LAEVPKTATYVALFRGINVGGKNAIAMADLRALCEDLGLADPRTLLQSGNLVVRTGVARSHVGSMLEAETEKRFGVTVAVVLRSAEEWHALIAANPFPAEAASDPAHVVVMCCKSVPDARALEALEAAIAGRERVRVVGADVYITYPDGIGDSRLTNAVIERQLATSGTARNWNTVTKIARLLDA
jgi:uncharacterized protein (DUF1697 family)